MHENDLIFFLLSLLEFLCVGALFVVLGVVLLEIWL